MNRITSGRRGFIRTAVSFAALAAASAASAVQARAFPAKPLTRSEEHTSELQSQSNLVCRLLLEKKKMRTSIRAANGAIFQRTLTEHDKPRMGTTVTALVLYDTRFLIGQVGDSRAYLYRDQKLLQLTKDHSYVQEQVDAGYLTPEQARS